MRTIRSFTPLTGLRRPSSFERRLRVADVLGLDAFGGAETVAGSGGLDRHVARANVMQVPTGRYARADDLVLAAADVFAPPDVDAARLIGALVDADVAGLAVRGDCRSALGAPALELAEDRDLPIMQVPESRHLDQLLADLLEALVAAQARELRLAAAVRDQLAQLVLSGGGLPALPQAIAAIFDGDVVLVDVDGVTRAASRDGTIADAHEVAKDWLASGESDPALSDDGWVVWPAIAGGEVLACLVARGAAVPDGVRLAALEHGARTAALELMNERETAAAAAQLRERLVRDLVVGGLEPGAARRRAEAVGWRKDAPYRVLLAEAPYAEMARSISRLEPDALVTRHSGMLLALIPDPDGSGERAEQVAALLTEQAHAAAMSDSHASLAALSAALIEAEDALRVARAFGGDARTRRFGELGALRMLAFVPEDELRAFVEDELTPLRELEPEQQEGLMRTLELLLETGLNAAETARRGGWHYNTVRYRMNRLTDLMGPFLEDGGRLQSLALALHLRRELP